MCDPPAQGSFNEDSKIGEAFPILCVEYRPRHGIGHAHGHLIRRAIVE
ncbi:hypothetical protein [Methylobacterium sp. GC_Met_2]|nr:hypothetical protein [Methylobacterium sp. GC_Met_2]